MKGGDNYKNKGSRANVSLPESTKGVNDESKSIRKLETNEYTGDTLW